MKISAAWKGLPIFLSLLVADPGQAADLHAVRDQVDGLAFRIISHYALAREQKPVMVSGPALWLSYAALVSTFDDTKDAGVASSRSTVLSLLGSANTAGAVDTAVKLRGILTEDSVSEQQALWTNRYSPTASARRTLDKLEVLDKSTDFSTASLTQLNEFTSAATHGLINDVTEFGEFKPQHTNGYLLTAIGFRWPLDYPTAYFQTIGSPNISYLGGPGSSGGVRYRYYDDGRGLRGVAVPGKHGTLFVLEADDPAKINSFALSLTTSTWDDVKDHFTTTPGLINVDMLEMAAIHLSNFENPRNLLGLAFGANALNGTVERSVVRIADNAVEVGTQVGFSAETCCIDAMPGTGTAPSFQMTINQPGVIVCEDKNGLVIFVALI